jgi:hypothetical protein
MYREIMLRNKSIFQISPLVCLSSISICNLLIDLPSYNKRNVSFNYVYQWTLVIMNSKEELLQEKAIVVARHHLPYLFG